MVQYSDYSCCPRFTKNSTHNLLLQRSFCLSS
nr:MAG TPA: hypothetical protein [Caudoviricetes sp.]